MDQLFEKLGLNDKETKTFLRLLELGAQPVSVVAKHVGIPRSSMYFILDKLRELKLIEEFERSGIKYVKCIQVKHIGILLRDKDRHVKDTLDTLKEKIPELELLENKKSITPKIRYFEGKDEVSRMYTDLQKTLETSAYHSMLNAEALIGIFPSVINAKLRKPLGKQNAYELVINNNEGEDLVKQAKSAGLNKKLLPKRLQFQPNITLTEDAIYLTNFREDQVSAVEINNAGLAQALGTLFKMIWDKIPDSPTE